MWCDDNVITFLLTLFLSNCTATNGNVFLTKVGEDQRLYGVWDHDTPAPNADLIDRHSDDTFTILFDRAFFTALPDPLDQNEVAIIFTFGEGGALDINDNKTTVKIVGPLERVPDNSYSSALSQVSYGPKKVDSSILSVKIQVIEYDAAERGGQSAFLEFISQTAQSFSLNNPITNAEIQITKEIAKSLIALNSNDEVTTISFEGPIYSNYF